MPLTLPMAALLATLYLGDDGPAKPPAKPSNDASPKAAAPAADPALADRYKQIVREFESELAKATVEARKAPTRAEGIKLFVQIRPDQLAYTRRMIELAEAKPKDPAARDALLWALDFLARAYNEEDVGAPLSRTVDLLVEHHADDPEVARHSLKMNNMIGRHRDAFLEGLYANAQGHEAKGIARLALAQYLERKASYVAYAKTVKGRATMTRRYTDEQGKQVVTKSPFSKGEEGYLVGLRLLEPEALRREAERLYRELVDEYGDVLYITVRDRTMEARLREQPSETIADPKDREAALRYERLLAAPKQTLAQVAADRLDATRPHVTVEKGPAPAVGMPATDIGGPGLDGKPLKLSEYRGKVVALVFWGSWCRPCMDEVPHERELVERLKGRPFALLGVNCRDDKAAALRAVETERMAWSHWYDSIDKPTIVNRYGIQGFPTVIVLDAKGIIHSMQARGPDLDKLVDDLLKEAEAKDGPK